MLLWTFYCRWYGNWFEQMLKSDLKYFSVTRKYNSMWQSCTSTLICRLFQKFGVNVFCGRQFMWVLNAIRGTKVVKWFVCFFSVAVALDHPVSPPNVFLLGKRLFYYFIWFLTVSPAKRWDTLFFMTNAQQIYVHFVADIHIVEVSTAKVCAATNKMKLTRIPQQSRKKHCTAPHEVTRKHFGWTFVTLVIRFNLIQPH